MQVERESQPDAQGEPGWVPEGQELRGPTFHTANVNGTDT